MGTVMDLSVDDLHARRDELLGRVSMTWDRMVELADAYALDAAERNIYDTIRAIDYLLDGDHDE
jgi:hypothetical protein